MAVEPIQAAASWVHLVDWRPARPSKTLDVCGHSLSVHKYFHFLPPFCRLTLRTENVAMQLRPCTKVNTLLFGSYLDAMTNHSCSCWRRNWLLLRQPQLHGRHFHICSIVVLIVNMLTLQKHVTSVRARRSVVALFVRACVRACARVCV